VPFTPYADQAEYLPYLSWLGGLWPQQKCAELNWLPGCELMQTLAMMAVGAQHRGFPV